MALDKLWTEAQSKVETKVADTKFLMLRDVLAKEGKDFPIKDLLIQNVCCLCYQRLRVLSWTNDVSHNQLEPR